MQITVCGLNVAGGWNLFSLMRPFLLGVSRWLSALPASLHWLTSLLSSPVTHGQRFVDVFTKHKQLGLHHIWACSGKGRWVYSGFAAVCKRQVEECQDRQRGSCCWRGPVTVFRGKEVSGFEVTWEELSPPAVWPDLWKQQFKVCQQSQAVAVGFQRAERSLMGISNLTLNDRNLTCHWGLGTSKEIHIHFSRLGFYHRKTFSKNVSPYQPFLYTVITLFKGD